MNRRIAGALSIALFFGCGGAQDPRSEDLTASQHEAEADREEQLAEEREQRYDPNARALVGAHVATSETPTGAESVNPTERHLDRARDHRAHAEAHRARAQELRAFAERECRALSPAEREACPLLLDVESIQDVEGGVQVTFAQGPNIGPVVEQLRCHIAFAAARGRDGMEECALYVHGARVEARGNVVVLTTPEADHVAELRERVRVQAP